jgi:hypothetical protein
MGLTEWACLECEHTFVPEYGYSVTEDDPDRPWIVHGTEHYKIMLDDGVNFFAWAQERSPAPRWSCRTRPVATRTKAVTGEDSLHAPPHSP